MKKLISVLALSLFMLPGAPITALAEGHDEHWHGDIHQFHEHDFDHWREGRWFHGPHGDRDGWWWIIGDGWYFYPAPVYPYPDPYVPPAVAIAPAPPAAAPAYWYYCRNPRGYYPYVAECFGHWHRVVATVTAPPVAMQAPPPMVMQQQPPMAIQQPTPSAPMPMSSPPMQPAGQSLSIRDQDDRQLNAFGVEFSQIDPRSEHASRKLKDLSERVEGYRQTLFKRNYNAMDILKDTEGLEQRIAAERAALSKKTGAPAPDANEPVPPPAPGQTPMPLTAPPN